MFKYYPPPSTPRSEDRGIQPALRIDDGLKERYEMWRENQEEENKRKKEKAYAEDDD